MIILFIFLLISTVFTKNAFNNLEPNQFLFIGDQFLKFNSYETFIDSFFKRRFDNFGVHNSFHMIVGFWDLLFFFIAHKVGLSIVVMEKLLFTLVIFGSLYISWIGFWKLNTLFNFKVNQILVFALTIWYVFNTYTLILWHGGVYNITSGITYSLLPLTFYLFHKVAFSSTTLPTKIYLAFLFFLSSFAFWMFAVSVFFYLSYYVISIGLIYYSSRSVKPIITSIKALVTLALIYIPMSAFVIINIVNEFIGKSGDNSVLYQPTFGNLQGGFIYQLLMRFSWGMYTLWEPRTSYSFAEYFFTNVYTIATVFLYIIILLGLILNFRARKESVSISKPFTNLQLMSLISAVLVISLFLGKAHQPPFGTIFLFLYEKVPFFSVFRSSDIRFGFSTVFSIVLLLLLASKYINKVLLGILIILISIIQSYYLLNGTALRGEYTEGQFTDRIVSYSHYQIDLANFLNANSSNFGYILPLPYVEAGHFSLDGNDYFIGQDILPKIINNPFVYPSSWGTIYSNSYRVLITQLRDKAFADINQFPIKYILFRKDVICSDCAPITNTDLPQEFEQVFTNSMYDLYESKGSPHILNSENIKFRIINPVKFHILFENVTDTQTLSFLNSYNKSWKLYLAPINSFEACSPTLINTKSNFSECSSTLKFIEGEELTYLYREDIFSESHKEYLGYANSWFIDPEVIKNINNSNSKAYTVNPDGSINFSLVLYYKDQSYLYLSAIISIASLLGCTMYLVLKRYCKK